MDESGANFKLTSGRFNRRFATATMPKLRSMALESNVSIEFSEHTVTNLSVTIAGRVTGRDEDVDKFMAAYEKAYG